METNIDRVLSYIIDIFKKGVDDIYLNVEVASKQLGLDKQSLIDIMDVLRDYGLYIKYDPIKGYNINLSDDIALYRDILSGICDIFVFDKVNSTMDVGWEFIRRGAPSWTVIVSNIQSRGRGRLGKKWVSPKGGLWFSIILRIRKILRSLNILSLACGSAVAESIKLLTGINTWVKWPNDVMINDRKIAGILIESEYVDNRLDVVVGCGINVNNVPPKLDKPADSIISYLGRPLSRAQLLRMILIRLKGLLYILETSGERPIIEYWKKYTGMLGKRVKIMDGNTMYIGRAIDINDDCSLVIEDERRGKINIYSGELEILD